MLVAVAAPAVAARNASAGHCWDLLLRDVVGVTAALRRLLLLLVAVAGSCGCQGYICCGSSCGW